MNSSKKYIVVFIHRQENVHSKATLENLYNFLNHIQEKIIFIEHPTLMQKLKDFNILSKIKKIKNITFVPFFDYIPFLKLLNKASYIITDSGGLEEEVCILKVPCLLWRKKTERPEAIDAGAVVLVGDDWKYALDLTRKREFYSNAKKSKNPYGDGKSAKKIIDIILGKHHTSYNK